MANRVFQNVVYQMKDAIDRVVGVVDETAAMQERLQHILKKALFME